MVCCNQLIIVLFLSLMFFPAKSLLENSKSRQRICPYHQSASRNIITQCLSRHSNSVQSRLFDLPL